MASITLHNLNKSFGAFKALQSIDLAIRDQEFVALLGPSGCGKSTTMNIIAGLETPSTGQVLINERDVTHLLPEKRGIGFVFQDYAMFLNKTVFDNLAFGLRIRGQARHEIEQKVGQIAELMRLTPLLPKSARALSVAEMQRVAIARSAVISPGIFLLDEPLSNLDAAFRAQMRVELRDLQRQLAQTMVYVTHDQIEAMSMADRIVVMNKGCIEQIGAPLEIYDRPATTFVAEFIGSPGMNLLGAQAVPSSDGIVLHFDGAQKLNWTGMAPSEAISGGIIFGVRPENIAIGTAGDPGLQLRVTHVEMLGGRSVIHAGEGNFGLRIVQSGAARAQVGETIVAMPQLSSSLLFTKSEGKLIDKQGDFT